MQTDKTTTESKQPLYKVLNEQRTQGDWQMSADKCDVETADDARLGIFRLFATEADEANAQYAALAVNNLHHLAEALEEIANAKIDSVLDGALMKVKAKNALKNIS